MQGRSAMERIWLNEPSPPVYEVFPSTAIRVMTEADKRKLLDSSNEKSLPNNEDN